MGWMQIAIPNTKVLADHNSKKKKNTRVHHNLKQVCCKTVVEMHCNPKLSYSHWIKANRNGEEKKIE